jgi:hypothetical protein
MKKTLIYLAFASILLTSCSIAPIKPGNSSGNSDGSSTSETESNTDTETETGTETTETTIERSGNIGVTTTQQMIEAERNILNFDLLNIWLERFAERFFIPIYEMECF